MRRPHARLAATCAFAVAAAVFTGAAFADPGNGNSANAPGQVKQEQAAQPQAAQPTAQAPTQAPGQAKKAQTSSPQAGMKPSSTTKHWQKTTVGASPDVSKRYGNGKTAAQIAHSRGAPDSQPLTGPGNSQPHKTYDCAHKNNHSGGVDVHAIKSYSATSCTTQAPVQQTAPVAPSAAPCGYSVVAQTTLAGKAQGHGKGLVHNKHMTASTAYSLHANGQSCGSVTAPSSQPSQPSQSFQSAVGALPATQSAPIAAAAPASSGGVLGAQTTLAAPKHASHGGVLGTVTHVAGASLPFTGFPVWIAILIALALIAGGLLVRRRGTV